ncbi:hypothetical protein E1281_21355 [Actinomadura sp. KC345]|uniref:hypothetical protein n=1 Tax=Actinomadura sp. KC345 TaxID=2530371 RepID=UPI00104E3A63|nr:hypothetical protein [Actinomadura sp. KC345]TDC50779.1 hypothetical protein E1281_21355 [Actinomadura sp. KC345]
MSAEFERLDELIVNGEVISALIWVRRAFDCSLKEAIEFFDVRYQKLRKTRPDDFTKGPEEYGRGVYT